MARNQITIDASAESVYAVLADPPRYADFVVGSRRIRGYDPSWPEAGSAFHHTLGVAPLVLRDSTVSLEADPPRRLAMKAGMRPFGVNTVVFELAPEGSKTRVTVLEEATEGPSSWTWNPLFDRAMAVRNAIMLCRLKRLAERGPDGG